MHQEYSQNSFYVTKNVLDLYRKKYTKNMFEMFVNKNVSDFQYKTKSLVMSFINSQNKLYSQSNKKKKHSAKTIFQTLFKYNSDV